MSLLVNNAGYVHGKTFMELPDHEIEKTFKVNILSHYWVSLIVSLTLINFSSFLQKLLHKTFDLCILFSTFFTDYKVILGRYDEK